MREHAFIQAYLSGETRGRALASAHAAGFSLKDSGIGSTLLHRPRVRAEIARQLAAQDITAARVLAELRHVAFSDMRDYTSWGPHGVTLKPSEELSDLAAAAVAEVSETEGEKSSSLRFKLHDKLGALTTLAKHLRLLTEEAGGSKQVHFHLYTNVDFGALKRPPPGRPPLADRNGAGG